MANGDGRRWLRYGCVGCLGLIGLGLLSIVVVAGLVWLQAGDEQLEERRIEADLTTAGAAEQAEEDDAQVESARVRPQRVMLDLAQGVFRIRPVRAGQPLSVEATFDTSSYELVQNEGIGPEGERTHEIRFGRKRDSWITTLKEIFGDSQPKVDIRLPLDVPMSLGLVVSEGAAEIDIGGLWLTDIELDVERGASELAIGEPLREPVDTFVVRASMGSMEISRLGNASPRTLDIDSSMGGFEFDLRGAWRADAEIDIRSRMSGTVVRLPRDVHIVGLDIDSVAPPEDEELPRPTLRFTTSTQMDEVEFIP